MRRPSPTTVGAAAAVLLGLSITSGVWGSRPPAGDDVMALVMRADRGIDLATHGRVDGWSPDFILGYEQFLHYGPGFAWLVGMVRALTFGTLSTEGALKVVEVLAYVAVAPAGAFLARSAGLSRRASGVAAILVLGVNSVFGVGLAALFVIGLVPQQIAASFFCVALGAALRVAVDPWRRWMVVLAIALAATFVTHVITAVVLGMFIALALPCLLFTDRISLAALGRLAVSGVGAVALAGFWTIPYLGHFAGRGEGTAWGIPPVTDRVSDILDGEILFGPYVGWIVLAGGTYAAVYALERRRWAALMGVPVLFMAIAHTMASRWPAFELSPHLANRGLGYVGLVAVLPLAGLLVAATSRLGRFGLPVALVVATAVVVALPGSPRHAAKQMPAAAPAMVEAAARLRRLVPDGARFVTERDFPAEIAATGVSHPDFWLARKARRNTLNAFVPELSSPVAGSSVVDAIGRESPRRSAFRLQGTGVTHVVTVKAATAVAFAADPDYRRVWASPPLAIFEVRPPQGQPPPGALLTTVTPGTEASLRRADPEHLVIDVRTRGATNAHVAVAWSPRWHLRVEGRSQPLRRNLAGTLELRLPGGQSRVTLDYRADGWERLGIVVTLLAWSALGVSILKRQRAVAMLRRGRS